MGGRGASSSIASGSRGGSGGVGADGKPNDATEYYVSGEGMWINDYLRGRGDFGELTPSEQQYIKDLDTATNGKIKDSTLYRNVDAEAIFGRMSDVDYYNLQQTLTYGEDSWGKGNYADGIRNKVSNIIDNTKGKVKTEKGYMSTTSDANIAEDWGDFTGSEKPIVMKIKTSNNTKGVNLSQYDKNAPDMPQKERLLARNQSYTVKDIYGKNGLIYVDVEMK